MIDFGNTGTVIEHDVNGEMCVQFLPSKDNKVNDMLDILDEGLKRMGMERTILIRSTKRFPVPCVLIYKKEGNK